MASLSETIRGWLLAPTLTALTDLKGSLMADISSALNQLRDDINGPLRAKVEALLARNTELEGQAAVQGAEEARESTAAADLRDAFNTLAARFDPADVPADPVPPLG
jgi:hypothetical protein